MLFRSGRAMSILIVSSLFLHLPEIIIKHMTDVEAAEPGLTRLKCRKKAA
jgi:hypothetical protein